MRDCRVVDESGKILNPDSPKNVALIAVNGSGKTELLADIIRYLLATVPGCVIPVTSSVYRQLEMLKSYFDRQSLKFPGWTCVEGKLTAPNGNWCRWFATDSAGAVESFHGGYVVRILDEVKSMSREIVDATNRWHPKLSIWVSSKGLVDGSLYEIATMHRDLWSIHEVDAFSCPWISSKWIDEQIQHHGRNKPLIKSMIFNEWNDADSKTLIAINAVQALIQNPPFERRSGKIICGLDLSAAKKGGDECVIFHRDGNRVYEPFIVPISSSEMEVVGRVVQRLRAIGANVVYADSGGLGGPMIARLCEICAGDRSIEIHRVAFNGKPLNELGGYYDRAAEMWGSMQQYIEKREVILPNDSKLVAQITSRDVYTQSDGKIRLRSKALCRPSPDRADALALCLITPADMPRIKTLGSRDGGDGYSSSSDYDDGSNRNWRVNASGYDLGGF